MKTLILPGYSAHNKDWAETVKGELESEFPIIVVYWPHWTSEQKDPNWIQNEVAKIQDLTRGKKINIIAKSIGTYAAMLLLKENPDCLNKIILCGIPLNDLSGQSKIAYSVLKALQSNEVLCISNSEDPHGSASEVEHFVHLLNPAIRVLSKPRSDHEYYYSQDIKEFLLDLK